MENWKTFRLRAIFRLFILMEFHAIPCLLRFLSITMGVKVAIYIHVLEIVFNASSGLFLFVNFAWKPHFLPWLRFQFHTKLSIMFEYVGRKYSFSSSSLPRNVNNHSDVSNSTSTSSISVQLTKCRNFDNCDDRDCNKMAVWRQYLNIYFKKLWNVNSHKLDAQIISWEKWIVKRECIQQHRDFDTGYPDTCYPDTGYIPFATPIQISKANL